MNAMRQSHADGWCTGFDTLGLGDDRLEAFYDNRRRVRCYFLFFFQAEDGIRDLTVTGVQTCALPIYARMVNRVAATALPGAHERVHPRTPRTDERFRQERRDPDPAPPTRRSAAPDQIGRASCRERV